MATALLFTASVATMGTNTVSAAADFTWPCDCNTSNITQYFNGSAHPAMDIAKGGTVPI
ncbi:hypothetical protein IC619_012370 [Hazenella sp. IB182353]|nr:hypothetical protein [Polycladospora coralii]